MISAILMWKLQGVSKVAMLGPYYAFYTYWAPYTMCTSLPMANTSGHTKKISMNAMFFIGYCVGNILGPQVFRASDAPTYHRGYVGLLSCMIVAAASIILYGFLCRWENRKRDKTQGGAPPELTEAENVAEAFSSLTDREKPRFRYTY